MVSQILKTTRGKWAVALCVIGILGAIGGLSEGSIEAVPVAAVFFAIAVILILPEIKAIKNPPPAPSLNSLGIHISQEALDAFRTYGTLPNVENSPVMLAVGEQAVYACHAERVETKNRRIGTTGSGSGASVRVAKGVTIRTGGTGSQSVYGDVEMVHAGEFVVTTERIVFVATSRAFEEKLSNISAVSVDGNCIAIMSAKESYTMRMNMPEWPCEIIKHCIRIK